MPTSHDIEVLTPELRAAADRVLAQAFARYPVMQFVLDAPEPDPTAVSRLVSLFTAHRWLRGHPVLGIRAADGALAGTVTLTPPGDHPTPAELGPLAERIWGELGADARTRYETLRAQWIARSPTGPRWHVNMIGVADGFRGAGYGSRLLRYALEHAERDPAAHGVDLTTEHPDNLTFYESHGFRVVDSVQISPTLETWILVRDHAPTPVR